MIFEIFKDRKNLFRFRIKSRNGKVTMQSEAYKEKRSIKRLVKRLADNLQSAILNGQPNWVKVKDLTV